MDPNKSTTPSTGATPSPSSLSPLSMKPGTSRRTSLIKPRTFLGDGVVERTRRTDSEHAALGVPLSEWLKVRRREQSIVSRVEAIGEDVQKRDPELAAVAAQLKQKHVEEAEKKKLTYGQMLWGRLRMNDKLRAHLRQFTKRQTKVQPMKNDGLSVAEAVVATRRKSLLETDESAEAEKKTKVQPMKNDGLSVADAVAASRRKSLLEADENAEDEKKESQLRHEADIHWTDDPNVPKEIEEPPPEPPEEPQVIHQESNLEITRVRTPSLRSLRSLNSASETRTKSEASADVIDLQDDHERKPSLSAPGKASEGEEDTPLLNTVGNTPVGSRSRRNSTNQAGSQAIGEKKTSSRKSSQGSENEQHLKEPARIKGTQTKKPASRKSSAGESNVLFTKTKMGPPKEDSSGKTRASPSKTNNGASPQKNRSSLSPKPAVAGRYGNRVSPAPVSPSRRATDTRRSPSPRKVPSRPDDDADVVFSTVQRRAPVVPKRDVSRRGAAANVAKPRPGAAATAGSALKSEDRVQKVTPPASEPRRSRTKSLSVTGGSRTTSRDPSPARGPQPEPGRARSDSDGVASTGAKPSAAEAKSRRKSHPRVTTGAVKALRGQVPTVARVDSRRKNDSLTPAKNDNFPGRLYKRVNASTSTAGSTAQAQKDSLKSSPYTRDKKINSKITPFIQSRNSSSNTNDAGETEDHARQVNSSTRTKQNSSGDQNSDLDPDLSDISDAAAPSRGRRPPGQPGRKGRPPVFATGPWAGQKRRKARQRWRRQARRSARAAGRRPLDPLEPHWSPAPPPVLGPAPWLRQKVWNFNWVPTEHRLGALPSFYRHAPRLRSGKLYRCQVRSARSERAGRRSEASQVVQDVT